MKNKVLFVLCLLVGLNFINGGLNKFFHYIPMGKVSENLMIAMKAFMTITWLMPLVAVAEIVGGLLLILPKTRALGAIILFPITVGILLTNTVTEPSGMPIALVVLAVHLWVLVEERRKYMPMIQA